MSKLIISSFFFVLSLTTIEAHPGIGIVIDSKGNVFYTDLTHVWKISPNGDHTIAVKNVHTHQLYIDKDDNLYGEHEWYKGETTDQWGNYVWCLTNDGTLQITIPEVEGFLDNNTLVRDAEDNSYWAKRLGDHQVINRSTPDEQNTTLSTYRFKNIRWMYFSKVDDHLYVVDNLKIIQVSQSGNSKVIAENLKENSPSYNGVADHHYIYGLCTDQNNAIYVAAFGASKVKKINPDGSIETIFESDKGWSPSGILIDQNQNKWIMEFSKRNKTRIIRINKDGSQKTYG